MLKRFRFSNNNETRANLLRLPCISALLVVFVCACAGDGQRGDRVTAPTALPEKREVSINVDIIARMPRLASVVKASPKASPKVTAKVTPKASPKLVKMASSDENTYFVSAEFINRNTAAPLKTTPIKLFYIDEPETQATRLAISQAALIHGTFRIAMVTNAIEAELVRFTVESQSSAQSHVRYTTLVAKDSQETVVCNPSTTITSELIIADANIALSSSYLTSIAIDSLRTTNTTFYDAVKKQAVIDMHTLMATALSFLKQSLLSDAGLQKATVDGILAHTSNGADVITLLNAYKKTLTENNAQYHQQIVNLVDANAHDAVDTLFAKSLNADIGRNTEAPNNVSNIIVTALFATDRAFAALRSDQSVVTWGFESDGGDSNAVADLLDSGVATLFSNKRAFAALKTDGSVVTWGHAGSGGDASSVAMSLASRVDTIVATDEAFAALRKGGSVVTWGNFAGGGDSQHLRSDLAAYVTAVYATSEAFAAVKTDGSIITWGNPLKGGSVGQHSSIGGVKTIFSNSHAFAALKTDGSLLLWGENFISGATPEKNISLINQFKTITFTDQAFAALKTNGAVTTLGNATYGGDIRTVAAALKAGVISISASERAFAALKEEGSVVVWGDVGWGGDANAVAASLASDVKALFSGPHAFAALKNDGSLITWGDPQFGGDSSAVAQWLTGDVQKVYTSYGAFVAVKADGSTVVWGDPEYGGNLSPSIPFFARNVASITATKSAFAALTNDGKVLTWGKATDGADSAGKGLQF